MLSRFAKRLTLLGLTYPLRTVAFFLVLLGVGAYGASRLEMRLNYLELLPEQDEAVTDLHWMMKKAGSEGYLVTGISGGTRAQRIGFAKEWSERQAAKKDAFYYAEYRHDVAFFRTNAGSFLALDNLREIRSELDKRVRGAVDKQLDLGLDDEAPASAPAIDEDELGKTLGQYEERLPKEYTESEDGTEIFTLAKPAIESSNIGRVHALLGELRKELAEMCAQPQYAGLRTELGGPMVFQATFDNGLRGDLGRASVWSLVFATLFLIIATRRPVASLLILLPVAVAIGLTLALAAVFIGHLTIVSGILVAVLLGLGVEFGIHLVLRTTESRAHLATKEALLEAAPETMEGAFSGAITNGAAFFVLVFCQFKAFREFGAIATCGILLSWLFTYALLPPMLLLVERVRPGWALATSRLSNDPIKVPRGLAFFVLTALPLFCLFGVYSISKIQVERSFVKLNGALHPDPVGVRAAKATRATLTPLVAWVPSIEEAKKLEAIYDRLRLEDKDPQGPILTAPISLGRVVHGDDEAERGAELGRIEMLLKRVPAKTRARFKDKLAEVETAIHAPRIGLKDIPASFTRKFTPLDGDGTFVLVGHSRPVDDADNLDAFVAKIEEGLAAARAAHLNVHSMSENRIAVRIFREVFADAPFIAWSASLVALLTLLVLLRSVKQTLVVFTPIALGMLFMIGCVHLYGLKLNFINMCVLPSIFTVAIDNTVHLYHRYHEEGRAAMPTILRHTGAAVLVATCVNASGYLPTLMANFYGVKSFGILSSFGMLGMLLATVVWFPLLLMRLPERRRPEPGAPEQP